ncbi:MAG: hypothetical protein U9N51_12335 [Bacteroidota bacterium]|nr:hypothetical protein [Bacteroidota bacterium]
MNKDDKHLVCVAIFRYTHRANILQGLLKEAEIESWVNSSSVFRQIDSVKLMINSEHLLKAREIIEKNRDEFSAEEMEAL